MDNDDIEVDEKGAWANDKFTKVYNKGIEGKTLKTCSHVFNVFPFPTKDFHHVP